MEPGLGSQPNYLAWVAALDAQLIHEKAFGDQWQYSFLGISSLTDIDVDGNDTVVGRTISGTVIRVSSSGYSAIQGLPSYTVSAMAFASKDTLVAASSSTIYRVKQVSTMPVLDPAFGNQGKVSFSLPQQAIALGLAPPIEVRAIFADASGRIYLFATAKAGSGKRAWLTRFTASGIHDETFGQGALVFAGNVYADEATAAMDSGKNHLFIATRSFPTINVFHVTASGIDATYGGAGSSSVSNTCFDARVAALTNGGALVGATCSGHVELKRLLPSGAIDMTFGAGGVTNFIASVVNATAKTVLLADVAASLGGKPLVVLKTDLLDDPRGAVCRLTP